MAIKLKKKPVKRNAGTRAGLIRVQILKAAAAIIEADGPEGFSVRRLATKLKVVPTTINSHFKGGYDQMAGEIAESILIELAPPYEPGQTPQDYLRAMFRVALGTFRTRPALGRLTMLRLIDDPYISATFADRAVATVAALSTKGALAPMYYKVVRCLSSLVLLETGKAAQTKPEVARADLLKRISALPAGE